MLLGAAADITFTENNDEVKTISFSHCSILYTMVTSDPLTCKTVILNMVPATC